MAPKKVLTLGDSLVSGGPILNGSPSWTQLLQTRRIGEMVGVVNAGVGGYTTLQTTALFTASYADKGYTHAVVLVSTNPLASGETASTLRDQLEDLRDALRADTSSGWPIDVTICTVPPRGGSASWDSTKEAQRLALNVSILAMSDITAVNLEGLGDVGSPLVLAAAYDSGDHLHLNGSGHVAVADAIDATVSW